MSHQSENSVIMQDLSVSSLRSDNKPDSEKSTLDQNNSSKSKTENEAKSERLTNDKSPRTILTGSTPRASSSFVGGSLQDSTDNDKSKSEASVDPMHVDELKGQQFEKSNSLHKTASQGI